MGRNSRSARTRYERATRNRVPKRHRERTDTGERIQHDREYRVKAATTIERLPRNMVTVGRIAWAWVPNHEDPEQGKSRPVAITEVEFDAKMVEVAVLATWKNPRIGYMLIPDWEQYGLTRPTAVTWRRVWVPMESLTTNLGYMEDEVMASVRSHFGWTAPTPLPG